MTYACNSYVHAIQIHPPLVTDHSYWETFYLLWIWEWSLKRATTHFLFVYLCICVMTFIAITHKHGLVWVAKELAPQLSWVCWLQHYNWCVLLFHVARRSNPSLLSSDISLTSQKLFCKILNHLQLFHLWSFPLWRLILSSRNHSWKPYLCHPSRDGEKADQHFLEKMKSLLYNQHTHLMRKIPSSLRISVHVLLWGVWPESA